VIDSEVVAFDAAGRPSFNTLQDYGSSKAPIYFYVFDLLVLAGRDLMSLALEQRRELLTGEVLAKADTLQVPRTSMRWSSATTNGASSCTWRERGMGSQPRYARSCSSDSGVCTPTHAPSRTSRSRRAGGGEWG
jgi:hypothetical protein